MEHEELDMNNHYTNQEIRDYLQGSLNAEKHEKFAIHLKNCSSCRERLEAANSLNRSLRGALFEALNDEDNTPPAHLEFEDISAYLDNTMLPAKKAQADDHLSWCKACEDDVKDLAAFRSELPPVPAYIVAPQLSGISWWQQLHQQLTTLLSKRSRPVLIGFASAAFMIALIASVAPWRTDHPQRFAFSNPDTSSNPPESDHRASIGKTSDGSDSPEASTSSSEHDTHNGDQAPKFDLDMQSDLRPVVVNPAAEDTPDLLISPYSTAVMETELDFRWQLPASINVTKQILNVTKLDGTLLLSKDVGPATTSYPVSIEERAKLLLGPVMQWEIVVNDTYHVLKFRAMGRFRILSPSKEQEWRAESSRSDFTLRDKAAIAAKYELYEQAEDSLEKYLNEHSEDEDARSDRENLKAFRQPAEEP